MNTTNPSHVHLTPPLPTEADLDEIILARLEAEETAFLEHLEEARWGLEPREDHLADVYGAGW